MSLMPFNREMKRAAQCKCRCYNCQGNRDRLQFRIGMYAGSHRPLQTLVEKEKEIAVSDYRSRMMDFGQHLKRQVEAVRKEKEKDKLRAKMLFHHALQDSKPTMTRERKEFV